MAKEKNHHLFQIPLYVWYDYKWLLLAAAVVLFAALYSLAAAFTQKETVLSVMLIDCHAGADRQEMEADYMAKASLNADSEQVNIETGLMFEDASSGSFAMTSLSRFLADVGSEKLDVCGMLEEDFVKYAKSGTWADLADILEEGELGRLSDVLLVQDGRVIGIYADGLPGMKSFGCYDGAESRGVLGVIYNSPHKPAARSYLCSLME